MGFLDKIKGLFNKNNDSSTVSVTMQVSTVNPEPARTKINFKREDFVPLESATCPYCSFQLDKAPSRKKKCPSCQNDMYVRKLPKFDLRVLVTEDQRDLIDETWTKLNGTYEQMQEQKREFEAERESLQNAWGQEPTDLDVEWHVLMKDRLKHASDNQWGLYRNSTLSMAKNTKSRGNLEDALRIYLEVCYLDLNGPNNATWVNGVPTVSDNFPSFTPYSSSVRLAPWVIKEINSTRKKLGLSLVEVQQMFNMHNEQVWLALRLPLDPERAWIKLETELDQ